MNIKDIAKIAGVSPSTVSIVFNDKPGVSEITRLRVMSVIEKVNYRPNSVAWSLVTKKTKSIGVITPDVGEIFYGTLVKHIQYAISSHHYSMVLCISDNNAEKEGRYLDFLIEKGVDGIIMVPTSINSVPRIEGIDIPVVFVDRYIRGVNVSYVGIDNEKAGYNATRHLIGIGHRYIGFISGPSGESTSEDRLLGYRRALEEAGLSINSMFIKYTDWSLQQGFQTTKELLSLKIRPSAVVVMGDTCALGVINAVKDEGLKIPEDMALISFDDLIFASFLEVPLTTVRQPVEQLGRACVELFFEQVQSKEKPRSRKIVLDTELIIRKSCGFNNYKKKHCENKT